MLATNLHYNSQERYIFEEVYINGRIELIKINKEDYQTNTEHKQIIIEMSEGIQNSEQAQELKAELEEKLNATIKVIKHTADEQNAEEHFHFQILSNNEINNQSIYKVANDFIKAIKGAEMTQVRIYDNSQKNSFNLSQEATAELLKINEDKFSFIKKDSKTHSIEEIQGYTKEGSKNATGLGKLDRPLYILNGVSNEKAKLISRFGIGMFKTDKIEITKETAIQAIRKFYESIGQDLGENWDKFLSLEIEESEDELSINFNNLIVLKNGSIASTAKNVVEEHLSEILKGAIFNEQLIIENDDRLKPKEKVLAELQYLSGHEHTSEAEQEEKAEAKNVDIETVQAQAKESQTTTDFYLDFMVEIKKIKTFDELEAKKAELEAEAVKVEAVRGILPVELINEKLEQIADKKELLSIVKVERTAEQALREELEKAKIDLAAQTQKSEKLQVELNKTTEELESTQREFLNSENTNKLLEEQAVKYRTEIKDTKQTLENTNEKLRVSEIDKEMTEIKLAKEIERRERLKKDFDIEKANVKHLSIELDKETKSHEVTHKVVSDYAQKQKELKATIEDQSKELKAEKAGVKKYNKLYNDTASKLEKTEEQLKAVNKKLADKEAENKGLSIQVKDFVQEVFNLKGSNSNLTAEREALKADKIELKKAMEDGKAYATQQDKRVKDLEEFSKTAEEYALQQEQTIEELKAEIEALTGKQGKGQGRGEPK